MYVKYISSSFATHFLAIPNILSLLTQQTKEVRGCRLNQDPAPGTRRNEVLNRRSGEVARRGRGAI